MENRKDSMESLRLGIPKDQFEQIEKATSLQSIYDLTDSESEIAFFIAQKFNIGMNYAFHIVWHCKAEEELENDNV